MLAFALFHWVRFVGCQPINKRILETYKNGESQIFLEHLQKITRRRRRRKRRRRTTCNVFSLMTNKVNPETTKESSSWLTVSWSLMAKENYCLRPSTAAAAAPTHSLCLLVLFFYWLWINFLTMYHVECSFQSRLVVVVSCVSLIRPHVYMYMSP